MLKKWLKRRRKSKSSPPPGFHTVLSDVSDKVGTNETRGKRTPKTNTGKAKSTERKLENTKIEKANKGYPPSSSSPRVQQRIPSGEIKNRESFSQINLSKQRPTLVQTKAPLEQKVDLPPVRIKPIKEPKPSPPRKAALTRKVQSSQSALHPKPEFHRSPSYLEITSLVGSPPSIDTALFATNEDQGIEFQVGDTKYTAAESGPPPVIETSKLRKKNRHDAHTNDRGAKAVPKTPPNLQISTSDSSSAKTDQANAHLPSEEQRMSVRAKDFFTARNSNSGTGSEKLQKWIMEVNRTIKASPPNDDSSQEENYDRYHIETDSFKSDKRTQKNATDKEVRCQAEQVSIEVDPTKDGPVVDVKKALDASKVAIDASLKETASQVGRFRRMASGTKGILKTKRAAPGAELQEVQPSDRPSTLPTSRPTIHSHEISQEIAPTKFFSASQRQRYEQQNMHERYEDVDIETSDDAVTSVSSASTATVLGNLPRQDPGHASSSDDATQKSDASIQGLLYERICEVTDKWGLGDDAASITDETLTSRSTISADSYFGKGCMMCLDNI